MGWITGGMMLAGALVSADAAGDAADSQGAAANGASGVQKYVFDKQTQLQEPLRQPGLAANNRLAHLLGIPGYGDASKPTNVEDFIRDSVLKSYDGGYRLDNYSRDQIVQGAIDNYRLGRYGSDDAALATFGYQPKASQTTPTDGDFGSLLKTFDASKMYEDPGYQFRLTEGMKGVENSAAARGNLLSGSALKAIQKYGQDYASNEYGNAYNRYNADQTNTYNRLAGLVNTGQGATNVLTNAAANYGNNVSNNIIGAGNAQAAGAVGQANAWNNAIGQGANLYQQNQLMNLIRNPGSSSGSGWGTGSSYGNQDYGSYF